MNSRADLRCSALLRDGDDVFADTESWSSVSKDIRAALPDGRRLTWIPLFYGESSEESETDVLYGNTGF